MVAILASLAEAIGGGGVGAKYDDSKESAVIIQYILSAAE